MKCKFELIAKLKQLCVVRFTTGIKLRKAKQRVQKF